MKIPKERLFKGSIITIETPAFDGIEYIMRQIKGEVLTFSFLPSDYFLIHRPLKRSGGQERGYYAGWDVSEIQTGALVPMVKDCTDQKDAVISIAEVCLRKNLKIFHERRDAIKVRHAELGFPGIINEII